MKTLRPLFGRETPGMDLSAADRAGRPALAATPTEMIAAVGTTMAATEAAWDAILAGVGDDADARAIAQLILRASRPSSDPFGLGHMTLDTLGKATFRIRVRRPIKRFDLLRQMRHAQRAHPIVL